MTIEHLRKEIDLIDEKIVMLLNKRMELAAETRKYKTKAHDPTRERDVMEHIAMCAAHTPDPAFIEEIFKSIIERSRTLQY